MKRKLLCFFFPPPLTTGKETESFLPHTKKLRSKKNKTSSAAAVRPCRRDLPQSTFEKSIISNVEIFLRWKPQQLQDSKQPLMVDNVLALVISHTWYVVSRKAVALWPQCRPLCIECQSTLWSAALRFFPASVSDYTPQTICPGPRRTDGDGPRRDDGSS